MRVFTFDVTRVSLLRDEYDELPATWISFTTSFTLAMPRTFCSMAAFAASSIASPVSSTRRL